MPELPEVETVRAWLDGALPGTTIEEVALRRGDLRYPLPVDALRGLVGRRLGATQRRGKYLILHLEPPPAASPVAALLVHLGMSGRIFLTKPEAEPQPAVEPAFEAHEHWRFRLLRVPVAEGLGAAAATPASASLAASPVAPPPSNTYLRYQDARRFGALDVLGPDLDHPLLRDLGPEPLGPQFDAATLLHAARRRRTAIKALLMDAAVVVGVGNIYASEACHRAAVDPRRDAASLGEAEALALVVAVRAVLCDAIAAGGTTLRDFVGGDRNPGYFQQQLSVYGRAGAPCLRCGPGSTISQRRDLGRATYFCATCQR